LIVKDVLLILGSLSPGKKKKIAPEDKNGGFSPELVSSD
jgi:hypothetical protein